MMNPIATEALYSATYVDNYIDSVENLPDDVQRQLSRIRDIDVQYRGHLRDVDHYYELWRSLQTNSDTTLTRRTRAFARMQQGLIHAQELGDEKMQIVNQLQELIDQKTRQLDLDQKNLDIKEDLQQQQSRGDPSPLAEDGIGGPTAPKLPRVQSPSRGEQSLLAAANGGSAGSNGVGGGGDTRHSSNGSLADNNGKDHNQNAFAGFGGMRSFGSAGGSTPNSERSANSGNGASGGLTNGSAGGSAGNVGANANEPQRSGSKRSRRRIDNNANNSGNLELVGNESNSNEGGSNGGAHERKSSSASSSTHKKNSAASQSQSGAGAGSSASGGSGGNLNAGGGNSAGKKKKRKARGAQSSSAQVSAREDTPPPEAIDPDEPTYCVCNQISFGEMILCDNDLCPIEWFHFSCVALVLKPKGKWYCPNCRGDRPNVMKPKAQFLKELERYNKEKEEKT